MNIGTRPDSDCTYARRRGGVPWWERLLTGAAVTIMAGVFAMACAIWIIGGAVVAGLYVMTWPLRLAWRLLCLPRSWWG